MKRQLNGQSTETYDDEYHNTIEILEANMKFLEECNIGGEFMKPELQDRVKSIGKEMVKLNGSEQTFLSEEEIQNLNIPKGTLLPEEREIINDHIVITIEMLEQLPYQKFKNVPEFAGAHPKKWMVQVILKV